MAPRLGLDRSNAMPLRWNSPFVPARTVGSDAVANFLRGEFFPSADASCGKPGSRVLDQEAPPSRDLYTPSQASPAAMAEEPGNGPSL